VRDLLQDLLSNMHGQSYGTPGPRMGTESKAP